MAEALKEHIYIIPLREVKRSPRWKRGNTAIKDIRAFLGRHMKSEDVKLDKSINEKVWENGSGKPPRKIRVRAMKFEDGQVQAEAPGSQNCGYGSRKAAMPRSLQNESHGNIRESAGRRGTAGYALFFPQAFGL